ncbi:MAG: Mth938-like domain-containing protein [Planctomycetota bacterium]|jgi:hypothetical protein
MIDGYRFGWMKVAGEEHGKDLIVFAPGVRGEEETVEGAWWRKEGHGLDPVDLAAVEAARPRVLVIGRGAHGRMVVPEKTLAWLRGLEIEAVVCPTQEATERYNELLAKGERVAGAFHLTC